MVEFGLLSKVYVFLVDDCLSCYMLVEGVECDKCVVCYVNDMYIVVC